MRGLRAAGIVVALSVASLWAVELFAAPVQLARRSHAWSLRAAVAVYVAGSYICHQRPERSFAVAGASMPVCGRCTGLYISAPIGAFIALASKRRWRVEGWRWMLFVASTPTAMTLMLETLGLWDPGNVWRAAAALPIGAAVGALAVHAMAGRLR